MNTKKIVIFTDLDGSLLNRDNFDGKKLMIVSFLEGKAMSNLSPDNCNPVSI